MGYALAEDVHACVADGTIFFLDVGRDRYCKAGPRVSQTLLAHNGAEMQPTAAPVDQMIDAGLLTYQAGSTDRIALCSHPSPYRDLHAHFGARPAVSLADVVEVAVLCASMAWRLRLGGFKSALTWARAHKPRPGRAPFTIDQLAAAVTRFQCARSLLPASPRCLLDSLTLKNWAERRGIAASLVIGIRPLPFAAHCWTEHEGIVLNGSQDGIANFVPICVL